LEALRDDTPDPAAAERARAASREAWAARPDAAHGATWLTTCDGDGRFVVAATTPQAVASLVLTVEGALAGGAFARAPASPDDALARQLSEVPGAEAALVPARALADLV